MLSGLVRKFQGEPESGVESYVPFSTDGDTPPQLKHEELEPKGEESMIVHPPPRVLREGVNGQGPDTVKLKRKITARTPPTNFFIDKVYIPAQRQPLSTSTHSLCCDGSSSIAFKESMCWSSKSS